MNSITLSLGFSGSNKISRNIGLFAEKCKEFAEKCESTISECRGLLKALNLYAFIKNIPKNLVKKEILSII